MMHIVSSLCVGGYCQSSHHVNSLLILSMLHDSQAQQKQRGLLPSCHPPAGQIHGVCNTAYKAEVDTMRPTPTARMTATSPALHSHSLCQGFVSLYQHPQTRTHMHSLRLRLMRVTTSNAFCAQKHWQDQASTHNSPSSCINRSRYSQVADEARQLPTALGAHQAMRPLTPSL